MNLGDVMNAQDRTLTSSDAARATQKHEGKAAIAQQVREVAVTRQPEAASLFALTRNLRREHRWEEMAWYALALSALVLLAMSFWL